MPTFCEDCDNVHAETRKQGPSRWVCVKFPRLEGLSPVAPKAWLDKEPYMRCVGINGGFCPMFSKRRDGQKELPVDGTGSKSSKPTHKELT
jgi:hypothetical protein